MFTVLKNIRYIIKPKYVNSYKKFSISRYAYCQFATEELLQPDEEYEAVASRYFGQTQVHNCFIVHPFVKWGVNKVRDTNPQQRLEEAIALIRTLAPWKVVDTEIISLTSFNKKTFFGSGNLERLKSRTRSNPNITAVFINTSTLKGGQLRELEKEFGVVIFDRYRIVMHILKLHAISTHAKLQVALAELPYIRSCLGKDEFSIVVSDDYEARRMMLQNREQKIKDSLKKLQVQREVLRVRRFTKEYPIVAVVGYTNAGKTSLIKALTGDDALHPRNDLFATLDVTMHAGKLMSGLEVLYVDTVGFISDIPTTLIECFIVTLEDAMLADVIIHVEDLSNSDIIHQRNHVLLTLQNLANKTGSQQLLDKIITVGNKCDLVSNDDASSKDSISLSSTTLRGVDVLRKKLEDVIIDVTNRKRITIRVPSGGDEMRWLYKNSTVTNVKSDEKDSESQCMKVIITNSRLEQFKHNFIKNR